MQDWILKSERIQTRILDFFTKQINPVNPRSLGSWYVKGSEVDSSVPFDVPWSERSCTDLFSKETQKTLPDSFEFKDLILDFLIQNWFIFETKIGYI